MTIKEIADFTGKNKSTIGRWVAKCNSRVITEKNVIAYRRGDSIDYSIDEVEEILKAGSMSKDAVRILMENARKPIGSLEVVSNPVDYEIIGKMIGMAVSAAMMPVVKQLENINRPALPAPVKEDFYSLAAYCAINGMKINRSEMAIHGRELKKICGAYGAEIHSIPDERWGKVNSYPVEILKEYFSV